jgi:hypothetical protein
VKKTKAFLAISVVMAVTALIISLCGCSKAQQYAKEARSSYISARAVLVGAQEFPAQMEELLRSQDIDAVSGKAKELIDDTRNLLTSASSSFRTCKEKCELLKGEGSAVFDPYADKMLELIALDEQLVNAYSEFIGFSNSLLENRSFNQNPSLLMPALNTLDAVAFRIQNLRDQIALLEEEAEQLYQSLDK